ncbi:protein shisa-4-like [Labrus bergylta]|uniref:protein shisa-4-like n=1 Tax=Labrus bergylta TaxID=56723 RepID=UPI00331353CB
MAVMVSGVWSSLVVVLCGILLPAVFAEYCSSFTGTNGYYYEKQQCDNHYCCGTCSQMYCCDDRSYRITQDEQYYCTGSTSNNDKRSKLATLLGSILGSVLPVLLCVGLVICCVAPCCLFYKKCRKRNNQRQPNATVIHTPQQPNSPSRQPGYQPVPVQPGFGGMPNPNAPPPYYGGNPAPPSAPFSPGQPMYPIQPNIPPAYPGLFTQPAYNPSHNANH